MNISELKTIEDYAKEKKVSMKTIYNWIKKGLIKPVIIGKSKFISK
jgi:hypothetical protein